MAIRTGQRLDVLCKVMGVELPWPELFDELLDVLVVPSVAQETDASEDIDWDERFAQLGVPQPRTWR